jgi:hypothetical protein
MSDLRPLPTDLRDHLGELTGNEYKVWTAYYLRTGDFDLTAHPSNQTIEQDTGLSNRTVKTSKARLISKGWLGYTGDYKQPRHAEGTYAVPVMEVRLPWRPDWSTVLIDSSMAYDTFQTVVQNLPHGTVVQNLHPEGYGSGSIGLGLDSSFSSLHVRGASPPCSTSKEKIEAKPANLEPTAKPTPVMAMAEKSEGRVKKARFAPDGTPWPAHFDSWTNGERLEWLEGHGWKQDRRVEPASQRTVESVARDGKPTATTTPLLNPPSSAAPPLCFQCRKPTAIEDGRWICEPCDVWGSMLEIGGDTGGDNWDEL